MYAQVNEANEVTTVSGRLPNAARRLDSRAWVLGFPTAPVQLQEACGWFPVVDTPRPADTPTETTDRSIELVAGQPTVVWTPRLWTADELTARQQDANRTTIDTAITNAITELQQIIDGPTIATVPDGTLTAAQLSNIVRGLRDEAQLNRAGIKRVAGTLRHTIRLVRGDYDGID